MASGCDGYTVRGTEVMLISSGVQSSVHVFFPPEPTVPKLNFNPLISHQVTSSSLISIFFHESWQLSSERALKEASQKQRIKYAKPKIHKPWYFRIFLDAFL